MKRQYNGIAVAMTGSAVPVTASSIWAFDAFISCAVAFTVTGPNGVVIASMPANSILYLNGANRQGSSDGQLLLSEYSITAASGTAYVGYSVFA